MSEEKRVAMTSKPSAKAINEDLTAIEKLVAEEYGTKLDALLTVDTLGIERLGRLVGVSLKQSFADPWPIDDPSDTGVTKTRARRGWKPKPNLDLGQMHGTPAYLTVAKMYQVRAGGTADDAQLLWYVRSSWEGSWFRDLAHAAYPWLCKGDAEKTRPVSEWAKEIATEIALSHPIGEGLKELLSSLANTIPWFGHVPGVTASLFALFIVKTSALGFCAWAEDDGKLIELIGTHT